MKSLTKIISLFLRLDRMQYIVLAELSRPNADFIHVQHQHQHQYHVASRCGHGSCHLTQQSRRS